MVKISVIIPVYNVEKYLRECLDSVINQTFEDIEIICINDGSTDNSLAILETYSQKDNRIIIINQKNKGSGFSRNLGIEECNGEYIYFMDSDDYIKLNTLEKLYNNIISNKSDVVLSKIAFLSEDSNIDYNNPGFDFDTIFIDVNFNNFTFNYNKIKKYILNTSFAPWMKLYKKEFLKEYNILFMENISYEDVLFHVKSLLNASKISFVPEFFYYYRNHSNSSVHNYLNNCDIFEVINSVEKFLIEENFYGEFKDEFDLFKITQILNYLMSSKKEAYFQKAKQELKEIKLSDSHKVDEYRLDRYNQILNSNTMIEYIEKVYQKDIDDLNKIINNNTKLINELKDWANDLNNHNAELYKQVDKLYTKEKFLIEKYDDLELDFKCLSNNNHSLKQKNKKLIKLNNKYKKDLKKVKKLNKSLIKSNSWKITKPLRKVRNILK